MVIGENMSFFAIGVSSQGPSQIRPRMKADQRLQVRVLAEVHDDTCIGHLLERVRLMLVNAIKKLWKSGHVKASVA